MFRQLAYFSSDDWEDIYDLHLAIIIKSEVWTPTHNLGPGHETVFSFHQCLGLGHETVYKALSHCLEWCHEEYTGCVLYHSYYDVTYVQHTLGDFHWARSVRLNGILIVKQMGGDDKLYSPALDRNQGCQEVDSSWEIIDNKRNSEKACATLQ